ncbi:MAG: hypothetical protein AAF183_17890 [Pseudomonadota bacterium]
MADEQIEEIMLRRFVWGESDCCLAVCDVLVARGYPDPAEGFRGMYGSERGAKALTKGDLAKWAAELFERMGWPEISADDAQDGDVGLVRGFAAIRHQGRWVAKTEKGLLTTSRLADRAWEPNKGQ